MRLERNKKQKQKPKIVLNAENGKLGESGVGIKVSHGR